MVSSHFDGRDSVSSFAPVSPVIHHPGVIFWRPTESGASGLSGNEKAPLVVQLPVVPRLALPCLFFRGRTFGSTVSHVETGPLEDNWCRSEDTTRPATASRTGCLTDFNVTASLLELRVTVFAYVFINRHNDVPLCVPGSVS